MTELLTAVYVGDVDLDDRTLQRTDTVVQCDARVRIGTRVQHDTVVTLEESCPLHLVDQLTLHVALIIVYLHVRIALT